jgi:type I restriction enzyme R subunit
LSKDLLKEKTFQKYIQDYLVTNQGYLLGDRNQFNRDFAFDTTQLFAFMEETQPKAMAKLREIHKPDFEGKFLANLSRQIEMHGMYHVLRKGWSDYGQHLRLAYFEPASKMNAELYALYEMNRFSVTEELVYQKDDANRIDLVIFLNGVPIFAFELKTETTGQNVENAMNQWKFDRSPKDKLFQFKQRVLVCFAMDTSQVYMTTRLDGGSTRFLPFNLGFDLGKGNPPVADNFKTHYMWEEMLGKARVLELIDKFIYLQSSEKMVGGKKKVSEALIFPRYHQLDAVRKLIGHAKEHGAGHNYLIQHSAGSGKTNTISWLAHRLATLHNEQDEVVFNSVIVVTDRTVLDGQLQKAVAQIDHQQGMVAQINKDSKQLADALNTGTKIIISTIQKFPFVIKYLQAMKGYRFAVIIDEAHSSTTGQSMNQLTAGLTLEEAERLDQQYENETLDFEDQMMQEIARVGPQPNISFVALTATPKASTLLKFGQKDESGQPKPFHLYAMKQAIEEGFILDVLKNYTTYKSFYQIAKKVQDDPEFEASKATKSLAKFVSLHPTNIEQKTEIMIEHFRTSTSHLLNGQAKAMVVTSSRLHAVRYKAAFDKYISDKGYADLKTLVAYSGKIEEKSESDWNGFGDAQLPEKFDSDEYQVLLVAEKYQTGFDQPKLQTMYVDKKLSGLKAVQTLSRLNRTYPGKEECGTFVLDFQNTHEEIQAAFEPYFKETTMIGEVDPNELYGIQSELMKKDVLRDEEIRHFCEIMFKKDKPTNADSAKLNSYLDQASSRFYQLEDEEQRDFIGKAKKFINIYVFVIQILPFEDVKLHQLHEYLKMLLKKISVGPTGKVDLENKIILTDFVIKQKESGNVGLVGEGAIPYAISGGGMKEPELDLLSAIIERFNSSHASTDFAQHRAQIEQLSNIALMDEKLQKQAENNDNLDDFKLGFNHQFMEYSKAGYEQNTEFFGKVFENDQFRENIVGIISEYLYKKIRGDKLA